MIDAICMCCADFVQTIPLNSQLTFCHVVLQLSWAFFFFFFFCFASRTSQSGTRPSVWNWALCSEESSIIRAALYLKTITWAEVILWGFNASPAQLLLKWWDLLLLHLSPFLRSPGAMRRRRTVALHVAQCKAPEQTDDEVISNWWGDNSLCRTVFFKPAAQDHRQSGVHEITWHATWFIDLHPGDQPIESSC